MSQVSTDIADLGGIISDLLDGRASFDQAKARLDRLGQLIGQQVRADEKTIVSILPPVIVQDIQAGLPALAQAGQVALELAGEDLLPYLSGGVKAAETAVDNLVSAAVGPAAGAGLNLLINGGLDKMEAAFAAGIAAQFAAWKAKLAEQTGTPVQAPTVSQGGGGSGASL